MTGAATVVWQDELLEHRLIGVVYVAGHLPLLRTRQAGEVSSVDVLRAVRSSHASEAWWPLSRLPSV